MSKDRKNWGEAFALGLLIGIVAAASVLSRGPAKASSAIAARTPLVRLTRQPVREADARCLADLPSPSAAIH